MKFQCARAMWPLPLAISFLALLGGTLIRSSVAGNNWDLQSGQQEFLDPDSAFVFSLRVESATIAVAHWDIAEGYYLYRDKFTFKVDASGWTAVDPQLPRGHMKEDPTFGQVEIYTGAIDIPLRFQRAAIASAADMMVTYQGCAEAGICYPPIEKTVPVELPAPAGGGNSDTTVDNTMASAVSAPTSKSVGTSASADDLAARLASDSLGWTVLSFIGFGLLLSFTPCVLPMVPILSGIIVGQGSQIGAGKALVMSSVYVFAMAATYACAGILAATFGQNLQAMFQAKWILVTFALVFIALALSMFDFYRIQLPAAWQTHLSAASQNRRGGTLLGVAGMGLFSALIVGPCVAPPLAGALIYIGKTGDRLLGGLALFSLGIGMGLPLLAVGTSAGRLIPRAGVWMEKVQAVFGILLLGVAIWLLERIIEPSTALLLWGMLLVTSAIFLGALDTLDAVATDGRRLGKALGIGVLIYGASLIVGGASGASDVFRPLGNLTANATDRPAVNQAGAQLGFTRIKGEAGLNSALATARTANMPVMLDFYADWCVECKQIEKQTLSKSEVRAALSGYRLLQADVTANDKEDQKLMQSLNLFGPPALLLFNKGGTEQRDLRLVGFVEAQQLLGHLQTVQAR